MAIEAPKNLMAPRKETEEERLIRQRRMDPQPPALEPLWTIDPLPFESGHMAPETEAE